MSNEPKETPYVYQPFGIQHKEHWAARRLWAVAADIYLTRIEGLTKHEAELVCAAMRQVKAEPDLYAALKAIVGQRCPIVTHHRDDCEWCAGLRAIAKADGK